MTGEEVIRQLWAVLPKFTDLFTQDFNITSMINVGGIITVTTDAPHFLSVGDNAFVNNVLINIPIETLTQTGNVAKAEIELSSPLYHDLTLGFDTSVTMEGATEADYNGTHNLLTVDNAKEFTYKIENDPTSPATGSPRLEQRDILGGYTGLREVLSVPSTTTFTYGIEQTNIGEPIFDNATVKTGLRISGAIDLPAAQSRYTKQGKDKFWAFVILDDESASKNRGTLSDNTYTSTPQVEYRQRIIEPFTVYIFAPLPNADSGLILRDEMKAMRNLLIRALARFTFPSSLSCPSFMSANYLGDTFVAYNTAYLIHGFNFETTTDITVDDTFMPETIALRVIQGKVNTLKEFEINLTEDLP